MRVLANFILLLPMALGIGGPGICDNPMDLFSVPLEDPPTPHFYYRFERPLAGYRDTLTIRVGDSYEGKQNPLYEGKVLEWGTLLYFWDTYGKKHTWPRSQVERITIRREPAIQVKPHLPDLTVAYVERLPRDPGWHERVRYDLEGKEDLPVLVADPEKCPLHPEPGQEVSFVVHILNAGAAPTVRPFSYSILVDSSEIARGVIRKSLSPRQEETVKVQWLWQEGEHTLKVLLDCEGAIEEIAEWNNTFIDPVRALTFFFAVSRNVIEGFAESLNCVDTFCFEDWAQYHVHMMNWLFEKSVYRCALQGIRERVRVDRIIVVEDSRDPEERKKWESLRRRGGDLHDIIEYNGHWEFGKVRDREQAVQWAQQVDWGLPHELGHQLGLVDIYQLNTSIFDCLVRNKDGFYANVHHFFPAPQTMMHWHGPHLFSEQCAGYLNGTLGRPRGYFGDYLYAVPGKNALRVLGNTGKPLAGVEVDLFQRNAWGENQGRVGPQRIASGKTDSEGIFLMPNQPAPCHTTWKGYTLRENPWGHIHVVGLNGMILARLRYQEYEEFHWLRIFDFNVAWFRGHKEEFTYEIRSRFPESRSPKPPRNLTPFWHRSPGKPRLELIWESSPSPEAVAYRVYRKDSHGGHTVKPFVCFNAAPAGRAGSDGRYRSAAEVGGEFEFKGFYSKDNFFAVTAVDAQGRESGLSNILYIPKIHSGNKLTIGPDRAIYFTVLGSDENPILRWTPDRGLHEFGLRTCGFREYHPGFGGIAKDSQDRFVVSDPHRHQLAFYNARGDLEKLVGSPDRRSPGSGPGEFREPADVAVDSQGRIYVADRGNCRIQVFDSQGEFLFQFGSPGRGEMQFEEPVALGCSGTTLCVSDPKLERVQVFDVSGGTPLTVGKVNAVRDPDRALVSPSGKLYVCGRDEEHDWAILVYLPDGLIHKRIRRVEGIPVQGPRGLCPGGEGAAYFVNDFPPEVLRIPLE